MRKSVLSILMASAAIIASAQGKYAMTEGEEHAAGDQITSVTNITMTFGTTGEAFKAAVADGQVAGYEAYTAGNGVNGDKEGGTVYFFEPTNDGQLTMAVCINSGKKFYITKDGEALADYNAVTYDEKQYIAITIDVVAGSKYSTYCAGSKLGFYGFEYSCGDAPVADTFDITEVTNQGNAAGEVSELLYQFVVSLPEGYEIDYTVVPTLNDIQGSCMPIDATTASVRFMQSQTYTTPGDYVLTIPAGAFTVNGATSNEYTATWTVAGAAEKTPWAIEAVTMGWMGEAIEAGAEVAQLSYLYYIATDKAIASGEGHIEFVNAEGSGIAVGTLYAEGKYIRFDSFGQDGYTTPGVYTLVIPAGALVDAEGNPCEEYTASWTVVAAEKTPWAIEAVTMGWMGEAIEAGAEVAQLSYLYYIATDKAIASGEGHIEFVNAEGSGIAVGTLYAEGKYIRFDSFGQDGYTTPGVYTLVIPAGALVDAEGNPCEEYTASWTVVAAEKTPWAIEAVTMGWMGDIIEAGADVDQLSYLYNIVTDQTIAIGEGHIEFFDAEGNGIAVGVLYAEGKYIRFDSFGQDGYTTPGVYTLVIPAGAIVDAEGNPCEEFTASWTVNATPTAIAAVKGEAAGQMFNLQGQRTNAAQGMVIVGGQVRFVK